MTDEFSLAYTKPEAEAYFAFGNAEQQGDKYLKLALDSLPVTGARVLDYGCGFGHSVSVLVPFMPKEIVGVEPSETMLAEAKRLLQKGEFGADTKVTFELLTSLPLPYTDANFQGILSRYVFHYISDTKPVLQELFRVLAPSGWLVAIFSDVTFHAGYDHLANTPLPLKFKEVMTARTLAKPGKEIVKNAQDVGFEIIKYEILPSDNNVAALDPIYPHKDKIRIEAGLLVARKI